MALETGKGLRYSDGDGIYIFGYALPNYLSQEVDWSKFPLSIINPTTTFDLSSLTINNEVIVVLYENSEEIRGDGVDIKIRWYRNRGDKLIFEVSGYITDPGEGYYWEVGSWQQAAWIGYCTNQSTPSHIYDEITENGSHRVEFILSGAINKTERVNFTITGIPVQTNFISPVNNYKTSSGQLKLTLEGFGGDGVEYINVYNSILGTTKVYPSTLMTDSFTATIDISSLTSGSHNFTARAYDINGNSSDQKTITIVKVTRPDDWDWKFDQLEQIDGKYVVDSLSHTRWNEFIDRINEFRSYKGLSPMPTTVSTKDGTVSLKMSSSNKILYAARFNAVRSGISSMNYFYLYKYSGDKVLLSDLQTLQSKLNAVT